LATKACKKGVGNLTRLTSVLEQCVKELIDLLKHKLKETDRNVLQVSYFVDKESQKITFF